LTRVAVFTAALACILGCGSSTPDKSDAARRTVRSWTATVRKTSDALDRGAVPALYGRQIVEAAIRSREEEADKPEWSALPATERAALDDAIRRLAGSLKKPERPSVP
jgi:hypothetical protein